MSTTDHDLFDLLSKCLHQVSEAKQELLIGNLDGIKVHLDEIERQLKVRLPWDPDNPDRVYAIGTVDDEGGVGMWYGPNPSLREMLDMNPQFDRPRGCKGATFIFSFDSAHNSVPMYRWKEGEWRRIE